jgi:hypothetical protein
MTTGDKSGIWGSITNSNLGSTSSASSGIEQAIVGTATITTGFVGVSPPTLTLALIDDPAYQEARAFCLNITAALASAGVVNVPAIFKPYLIFNGTGQTLTVKVSGLTGVSVPNGRKAWLYNNGTDVDVAMDYMPTLALGTALPTTSGGTGQASYTAGDLTYYASGTALTKLPIGSNTFVLTSTGSAPQWVAPSTIPVGTATNLAGGATGSLPYQSAASTTTFLSLGSLGQVMTAGGSGPTYVAQSTLTAGAATNLAGGAANRFPYQTGAGATTFLAAPTVAGSVILWDGSNLGWALGPASSSAANLAGGGNYTVVYQSSVGTTAYLTNGTTGQLLTANSSGAPAWTAAPGAAGNLLTSDGAGAWTSAAPTVSGPSTAKTYYMAQF